MEGLPNLQGIAPKVGAIFYLFINLIIDYVLIALIYDSIIVPLFTGANLLLYSALLFTFIAVKTGIISIIIALGGHKVVALKLNAIGWFIMNLVIDYIIIEILYGYFLEELFTGTDQLLYAVMLFFLVIVKTGFVSIMLLFKDGNT